MHAEEGFSSITAGPETQTAATTLSTGAPLSAPSTTPAIQVLRTNYSSQALGLLPSSTVLPRPAQSSSTTSSSSQTPHHSSIGAGVGGGLGSAIAISIIGVGLFYLRRRKKQYSQEAKEEPRAKPNTTAISWPISTLYPAELSQENSEAPMKPVELDSIPATKLVDLHEKQSKASLLSRAPTLPLRSDRRPSPYLQREHPTQEDDMLVSPVSDLSDNEAAPRRPPPIGVNRPDSVSTYSGPWHDRY
ncbi:MAG: hypothetical protein Q9218_001349 [Villophora microphyllina]